eukprot:TRINITY_DN4936_c0_g1_i2.p1 TRINITY_DN4936_c0_g1~~TRINITY_DN4936_c0_g1_i2.p1  ORF type:complete len:1568 (-),score=328.32 TRINITY_DN4936_c0_g1_i2:104-4807(-)
MHPHAPTHGMKVEKREAKNQQKWRVPNTPAAAAAAATAAPASSAAHAAAQQHAPAAGRPRSVSPTDPRGVGTQYAPKDLQMAALSKAIIDLLASCEYSGDLNRTSEVANILYNALSQFHALMAGMMAQEGVPVSPYGPPPYGGMESEMMMQQMYYHHAAYGMYPQYPGVEPELMDMMHDPMCLGEGMAPAPDRLAEHMCYQEAVAMGTYPAPVADRSPSAASSASSSNSGLQKASKGTSTKSKTSTGTQTSALPPRTVPPVPAQPPASNEKTQVASEEEKQVNVSPSSPGPADTLVPVAVPPLDLSRLPTEPTQQPQPPPVQAETVAPVAPVEVAKPKAETATNDSRKLSNAPRQTETAKPPAAKRAPAKASPPKPKPAPAQTAAPGSRPAKQPAAASAPVAATAAAATAVATQPEAPATAPGHEETQAAAAVAAVSVAIAAIVRSAAEHQTKQTQPPVTFATATLKRTAKSAASKAAASSPASGTTSGSPATRVACRSPVQSHPHSPGAVDSSPTRPRPLQRLTVAASLEDLDSSGKSVGSLVSGGDTPVLRKSAARSPAHERLSRQRDQRTEEELSTTIEGKLERAKENRERIQQERQERAQLEAQKVFEANERKQRELALKEYLLEERLEQADRQAKEHVKSVALRAQSENLKVSEVVWIQQNNLETAKFDLKEKEEAAEARLEERLREQRRRERERNLAEAAVHERRKQIEKARTDRLQDKEMRVEDNVQRYQKQRQSSAAELQKKAEEYLLRVEQQRMAVLAEQEERNKKHEQKMNTTAANRAKHMERIREKAAADIEKVREAAERREQGSTGEEHRVTLRELLPKETAAAASKRRQKLLGTMERLGREFSSAAKAAADPKEVNKGQRLQKLLQRLQQATTGKGAQQPHGQQLRATLHELATTLAQNPRPQDFLYWRVNEGLETLLHLGAPSADPSLTLTEKAADGARTAAATLLLVLQLGGRATVEHFVRSGGAGELTGALATILASGDATDLAAYAPTVPLFCILELCLRHNPAAGDTGGEQMQTLLLSYLEHSGLRHAVRALLTIARHPLDTTSCEVVYSCLAMLSSYADATARRPELASQRKELCRFLVEAVMPTLANVLLDTNSLAASSPSSSPMGRDHRSSASALSSVTSSVSAGVGLTTPVVSSSGPGGAGVRGNSPEPITAVLSPALVNISLVGTVVLNCAARMHMEGFQSLLHSAFQREFYHVASFILKYVLRHADELEEIPDVALPKALPVPSEIRTTPNLRALLHELLLNLGYAALQNAKTQDIFRYGKAPNLLQLLCGLPVAYFSTYKAILFATLVSVCFRNEQNRAVLRHEIGSRSVATFLLAELRNAPVEPPPSGNRVVTAKKQKAKAPKGEPQQREAAEEAATAAGEPGAEAQLTTVGGLSKEERESGEAPSARDSVGSVVVQSVPPVVIDADPQGNAGLQPAARERTPSPPPRTAPATPPRSSSSGVPKSPGKTPGVPSPAKGKAHATTGPAPARRSLQFEPAVTSAPNPPAPPAASQTESATPTPAPTPRTVRLECDPMDRAAYFHLGNRFPVELWSAAQVFFEG